MPSRPVCNFPPKTNSYGNLEPSFQISLLLRVFESMPPSWILDSTADWTLIYDVTTDREDSVYVLCRSRHRSGRLTDQVFIFDKDSNKHRSQFPVALESLACLMHVSAAIPGGWPRGTSGHLNQDICKFHLPRANILPQKSYHCPSPGGA